ncbi:MAG: response regulator [Rhodopirellula sp. JB044]|uniref:response regulator n=1 Tax=Rhodopirellula sp. JB044 TaxID=3342844 RepID=UPI00370A7EDB
MLVLTRKVKQQFSFVNLGITIEVLKVRGNKVQIGVAAPDDVRVLRSELLEEHTADELRNAPRERRHELRNKLNTVSLALSVLQCHLAAGDTQKAEQSLQTALQQLTQLDALAGDSSGEGRGNHAGNSAATGKPQRTALVVEDNAQERELLAEYLRVNGYQVSCAEDGEQALQYLAEHHVPDVVLLDMNMPKMNGRNTAKAIRCDPRYQHLKLFVVSGCDPESHADDAEQPYDQWFAKPLRPQEFVHELETQLGAAC